MKPKRSFVLAGALLAVLLSVFTARAQETSNPAASPWPKKPPFTIRLGTYFSNASGQIRVDGENGQGTVIDLQDVLNVPNNATVFRARADVRIAKWFGVEAEWYRIAQSQSTILDREITIGDEVFAVNEEISSRLVQNYLDTALKFYLVHNARLDLGLWLGATIHLIDFSLDAQPSGQSFARTPWYPVPSLGVCGSYTILPRLYLYGKAGYFYYKVNDPITKIDAVRFDITLDYYFWKALGVGLTYAYVNNSVEMVKSPLYGMVKGTSNGLQLYVTIGF
jgi:hypothetical protein